MKKIPASGLNNHPKDNEEKQILTGRVEKKHKVCLVTNRQKKMAYMMYHARFSTCLTCDLKISELIGKSNASLRSTHCVYLREFSPKSLYL